VQGEQQATRGLAFVLPPADVGNGLVLVFVPEMVEIVVGDLDSQSVLVAGLRKTARDRPRAKDTAFLQTQVEVVTRFVVLVQHERLSPGSVTQVVCCHVIEDDTLWQALGILDGPPGPRPSAEATGMCPTAACSANPRC